MDKALLILLLWIILLLWSWCIPREGTCGPVNISMYEVINKIYAEHAPQTAANTYRSENIILLQNTLPRISASFIKTDYSNYNYPGKNNNTITMDFYQPLFQGGRTSYEIETERLLARNNILSLKEEHSAIFLHVLSLYFEIVHKKTEIKLLDKILENRNEFLQISKQEKETGSITKLEHQKRKLEIEEIRLARKIKNLEIGQQLKALNRVFPAKTDYYPIGYINTDYTGIVGTYISNKKSYYLGHAETKGLHHQSNELQKAFQSHARKLKIIKRLPSLAFIGSISFFGETFPLHNSSISLGLDISIPFPLPLHANLKMEQNGIESINANKSYTFSISSRLPLSQQPIKTLEPPAFSAERFRTGQDMTSIGGNTFNKEYLENYIKQLLEDIELLQNKIDIYSAQSNLLHHKFDVDAAKLEAGEITKTDFNKSELDKISFGSKRAELAIQLIIKEVELFLLCGIPQKILLAADYIIVPGE